jgi:hypothetical protein
MLILAAEPKELTVVHMDGLADMKELGKLGGKMGVPRIQSVMGGGGGPKPRVAKPVKPAPPAPPAPPAAPAPAKKEIE